MLCRPSFAAQQKECNAGSSFGAVLRTRMACDFLVRVILIYFAEDGVMLRLRREFTRLRGSTSSRLYLRTRDFLRGSLASRSHRSFHQGTC